MGKHSSKVGQTLAKGLGIQLQTDNQRGEELARGESIFSVQTNDTFVEEEPTIFDWLRDLKPSTHSAKSYCLALFPFVTWIPQYNTTWLFGDIIAGMFIKHRSVSYIYNFFGISTLTLMHHRRHYRLRCCSTRNGLCTSRPAASRVRPLLIIHGTGYLLGLWHIQGHHNRSKRSFTPRVPPSFADQAQPVAVLSTVVGHVVDDVQKDFPDIPSHVIASALSVICGVIVFAIGILRLGWIVDIISLTSLSAFMTGSAITIAVGQIPSLLGESGFSNRESPYLVIINIFKNLWQLGEKAGDASMGITALALLYFIRFSFGRLGKRFPKQQRALFFANTSRTVVVILLYTLISFLVNRTRRDDPAFKILGSVPVGMFTKSCNRVRDAG